MLPIVAHQSADNLLLGRLQLASDATRAYAIVALLPMLNSYAIFAVGFKP
jgi:hypothetical protein